MWQCVTVIAILTVIVECGSVCDSNTHGNSGVWQCDDGDSGVAVCDGNSGVWQCVTVIVECGSV